MRFLNIAWGYPKTGSCPCQQYAKSPTTMPFPAFDVQYKSIDTPFQGWLGSNAGTKYPALEMMLQLVTLKYVQSTELSNTWSSIA